MDRDPPASFAEVRMRQVVWVPALIASEILAEADEWFDLETGGSFMGYWANDLEAVVTTHVHAGTNARRERFRFEPDLQWQQNRIDEHYAQSGRLDDYLGDWHTHPGALTAQLSHTDRACARTIIMAAGARQRRPIIMIVPGEPGAWRPTPFVCSLKRRWGFMSWLDAGEAEYRIY